jgi:transcriptional regulator with XRE-family HTH domain
MKTPSQVIKAEIESLCNQGVALSRISEQAGVDRTTLWKWLYGNAPRGIGATNFDKLCDAFGYSLCKRPPKNR